MITQRKIEAILLYFSNNTDTKYLGKVKLMKLFYFLDFNHVKKYGTPVTYDTYYHLEHGPIPSTIKNLVDNLADDPVSSSLKETIHCEFPAGTRMCRILPARKFSEADELLFSDSELEVLRSVALQFKESTTDDIEAASHEQAPWRETVQLQEIPYTLASHDENSKITESEIELALL